MKNIMLKKQIEHLNQPEPYLEIRGGNSLVGEVNISGAKNATLPAIVAACLSSEEVILRNVPIELNDVKLMINLLEIGGAKFEINSEKKILKCSGEKWKGGFLDPNLAGKIRHSLLLLGLAANRKTELFLPMPGGCDLGNRKHDMHVSALRSLGNYVFEAEGIKIKPGNPVEFVNIDFYYPTFGGTLNAIFASVCNKSSKIIINNAARNPEVIDVIKLLNQMGANITWQDENTLLIIGVEKLKGADFSIMPDRIIGATVIAATAITKGNVTIKDFDSGLLKTEIEVWEKAGVKFDKNNNNLNIKGPNEMLNPTNIVTRAYPGFHTDIQPLHTLMMSFANGESQIRETILDGRFKYCKELNKMGADITIENGEFYCVNGAKGQIARVKGVKRLRGAEVKATDIRGGAAVAVAGLVADGITIVTNLYQLERGYENFVELFNSLGADIKKISNN